MKKLIGISLVTAFLFLGSSSFAQGKKGMKGENAKAKMEKMATDLGLTSEQTEQVKVIFKAEKAAMQEEKMSKEEMQKLSAEDRKIEMAKMKLKRAEAAKATKVKLSEVLSAEQLAKYGEMQEAQRAKRKDFKKEKMEHKPEQQDMHQEEPSSNG